MILKLKAKLGYWVARRLFNRKFAVNNPRIWNWMQLQFARQSQYGHPQATAFYGHLLMFKGQGLGAKHEGLRLLKIAAQAGDAKAAYQVGQHSAEGDLKQAPNLLEAVQWWQLAAEQGHYLAAQKLAALYQTGAEEVAIDQQAAANYQQRAEQLLQANL